MSSTPTPRREASRSRQRRETSRSRQSRQLRLDLSEFAWQAIEQESVRLGVTKEELVGFAVLYYLADLDSGRIARRIPAGLPSAPASQRTSS